MEEHSGILCEAESSVTQNTYMQHAPANDAKSWLTEKDHVMVATVCVMMHGGTSAEMDFFEIPAPSLSLQEELETFHRLKFGPSCV